MAYTSVFKKIPKTEEDWKHFHKGFIDKDKLHMEWYEGWYFTYETICVKADEEGNFVPPKKWEETEETETVRKDCYQIRFVPKYRYYKILTWHRIPNHWE